MKTTVVIHERAGEHEMAMVRRATEDALNGEVQLSLLGSSYFTNPLGSASRVAVGWDPREAMAKRLRLVPGAGGL